jgi:hypothetical protein
MPATDAYYPESAGIESEIRVICSRKSFKSRLEFLQALEELDKHLHEDGLRDLTASPALQGGAPSYSDAKGIGETGE